MRITLITLIATLLLCSCQSNVNGEGAVKEEKKDLDEEITEVQLDGNFDAVWIEDTQPKMIIEAQQNIIDNLDVKIDGDKLTVLEKEPSKTNEIYKVYIFGNLIENLELNDKVKMEVSGKMQRQNFHLEMSNDTEFSAQVFIDELDIEQHDNASIKLKGNVSDLDLEMSNKSIFNSPHLTVTHAEFDLQDKAQATLQIIKNMKGEASGASSIEYKGSPDKKMEVVDQAVVLKK